MLTRDTYIVQAFQLAHGGRIDAPTEMPETTILREIEFNSVVGQKLYHIPLGEHFLDNNEDTEVYYSGIPYQRDSGFYGHIHRSLAPWMTSVRDACTGIVLITAPTAVVPMKLRYKLRLIVTTPPSVALVRANFLGGVWCPDYTVSRWLPSNPSVAPNAIQVATPASQYTLEFWRLSRTKGGDHQGTSWLNAKRMGRRYLPVFRGPSTGTSDPGLFVRDHFDPTSDANPWRKYRICWYNSLTGARSALSPETIVVGGSKPDRHNGQGPTRYGVWIER
jgi:hypothetical protein